MHSLIYPFCIGRRGAMVVLAAATVIATSPLASRGQPAGANAPPGPGAASNAAPSEAVVELAADQLNAIKIEPVGTCRFPIEKEAVGNIDFDDDLSVQVFPSYQGKLLQTFAELGDYVQKGQTLYTIDSPDLVQAESTLIGAAATAEVTTNVLARAQTLYGTNGVSKAELEQDVAAEKTAEGAVKAARDAVRIFGKTDVEMDRIIATSKIDPSMDVLSPLTGRITSMSAPPGYLVQPGTAPAPCSVADLTIKWLLAYVSESDSPALQVGQSLKATVMALPGRVFEGKITRLGATVDPNTRRVMVRCEIPDPNNELTPGMLATFVIQIQDPLEAIALPASGVVREGDGTFSAWITTDRKHFKQRIVIPGMREDGEVQILEGLRIGEQAVTDGAVFISNILFAPPSD
ncbi:MAG: efflux RND transporter periplasmic adaptor subunit [Verrucomicrobiota bacterium]|jgi:cobalt-zinc-cadmium efflux system membrane fusion protein